MPSTDPSALRRNALRLEAATIGWNVGEAVLTLWLGALAGSLALVGFGTVSVVEVFASGVVLWHLSPQLEVADPARTARALRLVGLSFAFLGLVLLTTATRDLITGREPDASPWGVAYLALTAVVMFALAALKRRTAAGLDAAPLLSEASLTFLDGVLSLATMTGLALNARVGWWWADPVAGALVGVAALVEARENRVEASEVAERAGG
jgi:divalent metal cation (Fe/Co/Zn/Cd) transporter